jgi:outer membrane protein assembly factor BamE (lipoprotein component of BamABCDE complex)
MSRNLAAFLAALALAGCATTDITSVVKPGMALDEVGARAGKPAVQGDAYWDYSRQPWGYYRVSFGPDKRVTGVRDLHTEANFRNLKPGMTEKEVAETVGVTSWFEGYATGTSWRYRYRDAGIAKLLHVIFDQSRRVAWYYWEWDPDVYSKGGPTGDRM